MGSEKCQKVAQMHQDFYIAKCPQRPAILLLSVVVRSTF